LKKQVTYYELERYLHRYIRVRGKQDIFFSSVKNVIVWTGVSDDFCEVYQEIRTSGRITCQVCDQVLYKERKPNLPITSKFEDHKEKYWYPMVIVYVPEARKD